MAQLEEEEATGGPCEGVCHCRRSWCWPSCFHRQATLPTRPQRGCALTAHCVHPRGSTLTYLCLSLPAGGLGAGVGLCGEEGKADHPDADTANLTPSVLGKRLPSQRSEGGGGSPPGRRIPRFFPESCANSQFFPRALSPNNYRKLPRAHGPS